MVESITINSTASIDTKAISDLYDVFAEKAITTLSTEKNGRRLTQGEYAKGLTTLIMPMLQLSAQTIQQKPQIDAQVALTTSQKVSIDSEKTIKENQSAKDLLLKDAQVALVSQQKSTESERTAQVHQVVEEAVAKQTYNVFNVQKQGVILDKQAIKLDQDTQLTTAQAQAIGDQVVDNRRIKIIQTLGDTYSTMAANTLTVSSDMWKVLFDKISELDTISVPAAYTITKVS